MTAARPAAILRHLEPEGVADAELLARFLRRDEAAFANLVRRHGPMILSVCRRITRHAHDAEDAFQAVFLILARKSAAIREPNLLGNWLHGVAVRVAQKAHRSASRRHIREVQAVNAPEPHAPPVEENWERSAAVHEELAKLPAKFREVIVLCDLRGETRTAAAAALGIPVGTLSSRLSAGREKLAERLTRRGIALAASAIPAALADGAAAAGIPDSLIAKTCELVAGWQAGASVPAAVFRLAHGGMPMRTMLVGMLGAAFAATGLVLAAGSTDAPPSDPPKLDPPAVKAAPAVAAKEAKEEGFTTKPRLNRTVDLPISDVECLFWNPAGSSLAMVGQYAKSRCCVIYALLENPSNNTQFYLPIPGELLGYSRDGEEVITALREYSLVSGRHVLQFWRQKENRILPPVMRKVRSVDLGSEPTHEYAFAADGKTFRTLYFEGSPSGILGPIEVREISAETGKTLRTLLKVEEKFSRHLLSPNGQRLALQDELGGITVWNVDRAKKESTPREQVKTSGGPKGILPEDYIRMRGGYASMFFSPDSRDLLIVDSLGAAIFDNEAGKFLAKLEGKTKLNPFYTSRNCFSAKNELVVMSGSEQPDARRLPDRQFLKVWEVKTGKLLKSWPRSTLAAWSPVAPVLAVIEPNGQGGTRLGLWDFSAEAKEKSPPR